MWPNEFATMLIDLSGASGDYAVSLVAIFATAIYFAAAGGLSIVATLGIWELLDRREAKKRNKV